VGISGKNREIFHLGKVELIPKSSSFAVFQLTGYFSAKLAFLVEHKINGRGK
jgi:hypothetical protein